MEKLIHEDVPSGKSRNKKLSMDVGSLKKIISEYPFPTYGFLLPIYRVHVKYYDNSNPITIRYDDWVEKIGGIHAVCLSVVFNPIDKSLPIHIHKPVSDCRELLNRLSKFDDDLPVVREYIDCSGSVQVCESIVQVVENFDDYSRGYKYSDCGRFITGLEKLGEYYIVAEFLGTYMDENYYPCVYTNVTENFAVQDKLYLQNEKKWMY